MFYSIWFRQAPILSLPIKWGSDYLRDLVQMKGSYKMQNSLVVKSKVWGLLLPVWRQENAESHFSFDSISRLSILFHWSICLSLYQYHTDSIMVLGQFPPDWSTDSVWPSRNPRRLCVGGNWYLVPCKLISQRNYPSPVVWEKLTSLPFGSDNHVTGFFCQ